MTNCAAKVPSPAVAATAEPSLTFAYFHANKRGIVLDYRSPDATGALAELGAQVDVVLLTPPVTGFDADSRQLSWAAGNAIVCSITRFGFARPVPDLARHPPHVVRARLAPCPSMGRRKGHPWSCHGRQHYAHVGTHTAIAVLAALRARPASGGQFVDISA